MKNGQWHMISLLRNRKLRGEKNIDAKVSELPQKEKNSLDCSAAVTSSRIHCFVCRLRSAENKYLQLRASKDNEHPEAQLHPKVLWESS